MIFNKFQIKQALSLVENLLKMGVRISISEVKEKRTINQNSLYWLWIACLSAETGNDSETLHEYFKSSYLPIKLDIIFDKEVTRLTSTTKLNTAEFKAYLDKIQLFAGEQGITLPNPEDKHWAEFYETYKDLV